MGKVLLGALISIPIAVGAPRFLEAVRRPKLEVEIGDLVDVPQWCIAHVRVRNVPLAERWFAPRYLGRWLTALPADGCALSLSIIKDGGDPISFAGKWSSRVEPVSTDLIAAGGSIQRIDRYDPQKLPEIHNVSLQPGMDGDSVAVAIRPRGRPGYAYWAERIVP